MKKYLVALTTVTVVGLSGVFLSDAVQAETIGEIQDERSSIKADLSDAEAKIADVLMELKELNDEIERVDEALVQNREMIATTEEDLTNTEEEVSLLEDEISELEEVIEIRFDILKGRVKSYQKSGGNIGFLDVLFGSASFGDFISRVTAVTKIADSDTRLMEKQEEDKAVLEEKQDKVMTKLTELKDMKSELEGMNALIIEQQEENEDKKKELKKKERNLLELKAELQVKDSNLAALEEQINRSVTTTESGTNSDGNLTQLSSKTSNKVSSKPVQRVSGNGNLNTAINVGYNHLGTPYVWAGKSPGGFDCSGFVSWAFAQGGYSIPSSTAGLQSTGTKVSYSNVQPGDLVFFNTYKTNGHVGIYVGNGNFIGAQNSTGVAVANMTSGYWKNHFAGHVRRVR
ncbi:NlpC/P60 family protein [Virgibacillus byunsanensis]|uniref:NlpC/P60 family protein n=1 Tax=Virgibacillus byunsanensis TaxID=570945 RepID=A0ABW3LL51_9BACI